MVAVLEGLWPLSSALSWKPSHVTEQRGRVALIALVLGARCDFRAEVTDFTMLWSGAAYARPLTAVRHLLLALARSAGVGRPPVWLQKRNQIARSLPSEGAI